MAQSRGGNTRLAYVEEASFGVTPPGPQMRLLPFYQEELEVEHGPFLGVKDGLERVITWAVQGYIDAGGRVGLELELDSLGTLLKHTLGTSTTTGGQPPFTHVIKGGVTPPLSQGLSIEKAFLDIGQFLLFKGCRIDRLSVEFEPRESPGGSLIAPPKADLELVAKGVEASTTSAASSVVEGQGMALSYYLTVEEGGLVLNNLLGARLTMENHLQKDGYVLNSRERYSISAGLRRVSGALHVGLEDMNYYSKLMDNTATSLKLKVLQGSSSLEFYLPRVVFAGKAPLPGVKEAGPQGASLPFVALKDPLEGTDIKVTLINNVSSI